MVNLKNTTVSLEALRCSQPNYFKDQFFKGAFHTSSSSNVLDGSVDPTCISLPEEVKEDYLFGNQFMNQN